MNQRLLDKMNNWIPLHFNYEYPINFRDYHIRGLQLTLILRLR